MPRGRGLWEATKHVGAVLALESLIPAISIAGVLYLIDRVRPDLPRMSILFGRWRKMLDLFCTIHGFVYVFSVFDLLISSA